MTQDETWQARLGEVFTFIGTRHRNPSRHDPAERGRYLNWIKHNRKLLNAGEMKADRVAAFRELLALMEGYRRKNQYE